MDVRPLADALTALLITASYGYVGVRLARRPVAPAARAAGLGFAAWWFGIAAASSIAALSTLLLVAGLPDAALHVTLLQLVYLFFAAGLGGLLYYVVFLYTGRPGFLLPVGAVYAAFYLLHTYRLARMDIVGFEGGGWRPEPVALASTPPALSAAVTALFAVPLVLGGLGLAGLMLRVREPGQRYRLALLVVALLAFALSGALVQASSLRDDDLVQGAGRLVLVASAFLLLAAYHPPAWARRRWRASPLGPLPPS